MCKLAKHIIFTFNSIIWLPSGSHWSRNFPMQCSIACNGARTGKSSCLDTALSFFCKEVVLVRFLEAVLSKSHHFQIAALLHRLLKFSLEFKHHTYKNLIIYHIYLHTKSDGTLERTPKLTKNYLSFFFHLLIMIGQLFSLW